MVAGIAKVLGKNPEDLWSSVVKWTIAFLIFVIAATLSAAAVQWAFRSTQQKGGQPAPSAYFIQDL